MPEVLSCVHVLSAYLAYFRELERGETWSECVRYSQPDTNKTSSEQKCSLKKIKYTHAALTFLHHQISSCPGEYTDMSF